MSDNGYVKKAPRYCHHCGDQVSTSGPEPRSGRRYCSRPGCKAAKERHSYETRNSLKRTDPAPEHCTSCNAQLPARTWRAGDEIGRWCRKLRCRTHRDETRASAGAETVAELTRRLSVLETALEFASDAVRCDSEEQLGYNRVICPDCGLTSAIRQWVHPDEDGGVCHGTLDGIELRKYGASGRDAAWPFARKYMPAHLRPGAPDTMGEVPKVG